MSRPSPRSSKDGEWIETHCSGITKVARPRDLPVVKLFDLSVLVHISRFGSSIRLELDFMAGHTNSTGPLRVDRCFS